MKTIRTTAIALFSAIILLSAEYGYAGHSGSTGIVASIDKAPVIADGDVRRKPTDYLITLDVSLDPNQPGKSLAAGDQIRVIFPQSFDLANVDPSYPLADLPTFVPPGVLPCLPGNLQCSTAVILPGWPQNPLFPPAAFHALTIDTVDNALVYTARQDINETIKQLHLILNGVLNPRPGRYRIHVEAQTGPAGEWETGSGILRVLPRTRPSINITSVFIDAWKNGEACLPGKLPPNPDNPIYQSTAVNSEVPFVWTFLLWGKRGKPLDDVWIKKANPNRLLLKRGKRTIGHIFIDAPKGATGYGLALNPSDCGTLLPAAPVIGATVGIGPQPVGRLDLLFNAGDLPGLYTTNLRLNNGNTVQMFVTATN